MRKFIHNLKTKDLVIVFFFSILLLGCTKNQKQVTIKQNSTEVVQDTFKEIIWHVKAFHPDAKLLDVKAVDEAGNIYDVKAIQYSDQTSIMDVKAFVNGKKLPVKLLVSENKYLPMKVIKDDGTLMDIYALTSDGQKLDVKGVSQSGNIVHIKAITDDGMLYNIEAISPKGWINDVKGVKMTKENVEATINGVDVFAHIKSIPQAY